MPVERLQHADTRLHQEVSAFSGTDQATYRGLPRLKVLFGLGKLEDVIGGLPERHKLAAIRKHDRIFECLLPAAHGGVCLSNQLWVSRSRASRRLAGIPRERTAREGRPSLLS